MKNKITIFLFLLIANTTIAQTNEVKAMELYNQALEKFETKYYNEALDLCIAGCELFNYQPPVKLAYLLVVSNAKAFCDVEKDNKSNKCKKNDYLSNYESLLANCNYFIGKVNKETYPTEKYNEVVEAKNFAEAGIKKYAYQKDRKPQDAINFLNDCAAKFKTGDYLKFTLDSCYLKIVWLDAYEGSKKKYNRIDAVYWVIDLSKTTEIVYEKEKRNSNARSWNDYKGDIIADAGFYLNGQTDYINGQKEMVNSRYAINSYYDEGLVLKDEYKVPMNWTVQQPKLPSAPSEIEIVKKGKKNKIEIPEQNIEAKASFKVYRIHSYFKVNEEYNDEKYSDRIKEAFQFLVGYFPKKKQENNTEVKSKF